MHIYVVSIQRLDYPFYLGSRELSWRRNGRGCRIPSRSILLGLRRLDRAAFAHVLRSHVLLLLHHDRKHFYVCMHACMYYVCTARSSNERTTRSRSSKHVEHSLLLASVSLIRRTVLAFLHRLLVGVCQAHIGV